MILSTLLTTRYGRRIALGAGALLLLPILFLGAGAGAFSFAQASTDTPTTPEGMRVADIPGDYLIWYQRAAHECRPLDWTVLAGIGKIESDHGRSTLPGVRSGANSAGAQGPMQFLPATFRSYANPPAPDGLVPPTPFDPPDAIYAAARMLCANGARFTGGLHDAIFAYNHSETYVQAVLDQADEYAQATLILPAMGAAQAAVNFAFQQIGLPYLWGGNGPVANDPGFDCSGLTHAAYHNAGIDLPRTAQTQYDHGPHLPPNTPLFPGDLLFYGTPDNVHHVAIYAGNHQAIHAPHAGQTVTLVDIDHIGSDYLGATRPAATAPITPAVPDVVPPRSP